MPRNISDSVARGRRISTWWSERQMTRPARGRGQKIGRRGLAICEPDEPKPSKLSKKGYSNLNDFGY